MKVLFLDIDGVLNGIRYVRSFGRFGLIIDPVRMERLRQIVDATGALIVLSSSWREHWQADASACDSIGLELNRLFRSHRLEIFDKTPERNFDRDGEIQSWLRCYPQVSSFVILDDTPPRSAALMDHCVLTRDNEGGLMPQDVDRAIQMLTL